MEMQLNTRSVRATMEERDGYLVFTVTGQYDFNDFKVLVHAFQDACVRAKAPKALVNIQDVSGETPNIDRYNLGQLFAEVWGGVLKAGIIGSRDRINKLFENTAVNRYAQVMVHHDEKTVLDWLLGSGAP